MYRHVPGLDAAETTSVVEAEPGVFWIGSAGQGLRQFDPADRAGPHLPPRAQRAGSLPSDFVEQVKLDRQGAVWAVTWRGLARWEPASEQFVTYLPAGAPMELTFHTATFARTGVVWIGSNLGMHRLDPVGQTLQWFRHDKGDATSLSNDRVNSIHEAADGSMWIGTQNGLDHWDSNAKAVKHYGPEDGLPGSARELHPRRRCTPALDEHRSRHLATGARDRTVHRRTARPTDCPAST